MGLCKFGRQELAILVFISTLMPTARAKTITVSAGKSIQEAVARAVPGDTIAVEAGTYAESVVVEKPGIHLIGIPKDGKWPVLEGGGQRNDGVIASGSGFEFAYFRVQNYKGNGVMTQGADDVRLHHLIINDTGIYGIYPTRGKKVLVEDTISWGIADAAIYIGMCQYVDVRRNEVFKSVAGIEIENSHHALVEDNSVHDNTGGILVFTLPGLPEKTGFDTIVRRNIVTENNLKNFGAEGAVVSQVPRGSGMIVLAGDGVQFEDNIVRGNETGGLIFSDMDFMADSTAPDPAVDPQYDDNKVLGNIFLNNGASPTGKVRLLLVATHFSLHGADIIGYGKGRRNCIRSGMAATTLGTEAFTQCAAKETTASIKSMFDQAPALEVHQSKDKQSGETLFNAVCAGCHGQGIRLIGPPVEEIQAKYKGNSQGIVEYAYYPTKMRNGYPSMPSQSHLGKVELKKIADYLLGLVPHK